MNLSINIPIPYLVAVSGSIYTYIVGVDRQDVLLCDPMDSSVTLTLLRWEVENGPSFLNPVNINGLKDSLSNQSTTKINCNSGGTLLASIFINIIGMIRFTLLA